MSTSHNRTRGARRPSLRAAWKAASITERRRFIAELLVDLVPRTPAPATVARSTPIDEAPGLEAFLSSCVVKSPGGRVQSATLYEAYRQFAFTRGEEPLTHKAVSTQLSKRGYLKRHSNVVLWLGIRLVTAATHGGATC